MKRFVCVIAAVLLGSLLVPPREIKAQSTCFSPGLEYRSSNLNILIRYGEVAPNTVNVVRSEGISLGPAAIDFYSHNNFHISYIHFEVEFYANFLPAHTKILRVKSYKGVQLLEEIAEVLPPNGVSLTLDFYGKYNYRMLLKRGTNVVTLSVEPFVPDILGGRIDIKIIEVCLADGNLPPTRTPTPTATFTPITHTPTASGTPTPITHTPTMTPIVISMEDIQRPPMLSDECRDIANPCSIFPTIAFATIALPSPTRRPTLAFTPTPSITPSPTETATPTNTPTPNQTITVTPTDCWGYCDPTVVADFGGAVATAGAFRLDIVDARGTPIGFDTAVRLGALAGGVFAVVRSFANTENPASWLIGILLLSVGFIAFVWVLVYFVPILLRMAGLLMQLLQILLRVVR